MKKWLIGLLLAVYIALGSIAWAQPAIPPRPPSSIYVQDYAGALSRETQGKINRLGAKVAEQSKAQGVVVIVQSLNEIPIQEYANELLRQWKIGDKEKNNGFVIVVALKDRQSRIEVGYGLEGALNDAKAGRLQDEYLIPMLQQGKVDAGVWEAYKAVMRVVTDEYNAGGKAETRNTTSIGTSTNLGSWSGLPWWAKWLLITVASLLLIYDWLFLGGMVTFMILALFRTRSGDYGGGYGGGSGGGGGADRKW
jgi:uncharacterized protein